MLLKPYMLSNLFRILIWPIPWVITESFKYKAASSEKITLIAKCLLPENDELYYGLVLSSRMKRSKEGR